MGGRKSRRAAGEPFTLRLCAAGFEPRRGCTHLARYDGTKTIVPRGDATRTHGSNPVRLSQRSGFLASRRDFRPTCPPFRRFARSPIRLAVASPGKECDCECLRHDGSFPSRISFATQSSGSSDRLLRSLYGEPGCDGPIDSLTGHRRRSPSESNST